MLRHANIAPPIALVLALALAAGCTSDDPNGVGADLTSVAVDTAFATLTLRQASHFGVLDVTSGVLPLDQYETLYLGRDGDDASSILATFDFSGYPDAHWTAQYLQASNIQRVALQLQMLTWYEPNHGADLDSTGVLPRRYWQGARKWYDVHQLQAPFDTLSYPGPEPAFAPERLNVSQELAPANGPIQIDLSPAQVAAWITTGARVSIIVREGTGSGAEPGLLAFASKEMVHGGSTLPPLNAGVTVGPTLIIYPVVVPPTLPNDVTNLVVEAVADVSTWYQVGPIPTDLSDGLVLRTHLRSYPVLGYDLTQLPDNARINRAEIILTTDTTRTVGPAHVLVVSEVVPDFAPAGVTSVLLEDIEPEVEVVSGRTGLNPEDPASDTIALNVTASVQRFINGAYVGSRAFLLSEGERFLTGYRTNPGPDFYFRRRTFYGTSDPDSTKRPRLRIIYSRENAVTGGQP